MDLLAQRYADPFSIMDQFIYTRQLREFLCDTLERIVDERRNKYRWEYYIHKVHDMSFEEYCRYCDSEEKSNVAMSSKEIGEVINNSMKMLNEFTFT